MVEREVHIKASVTGIEEAKKQMADLASEVRILKEANLNALKESLKDIPKFTRDATLAIGKFNEKMGYLASNIDRVVDGLHRLQQVQSTITLPSNTSAPEIPTPTPKRRKEPKPVETKPIIEHYEGPTALEQILEARKLHEETLREQEVTKKRPRKTVRTTKEPVIEHYEGPSTMDQILATQQAERPQKPKTRRRKNQGAVFFSPVDLFSEEYTPYQRVPELSDLHRLYDKSIMSGKEELFMKDLASGKDITPPYTSTSRSIRIQLEGRELKKLYSNLLTAYHTHPISEYPIPSPHDLANAFKTHGAFGIIAGSGKTLEIQTPTTQNANAIINKWLAITNEYNRQMHGKKIPRELYERELFKRFIEFSKQNQFKTRLYDISKSYELGEFKSIIPPEDFFIPSRGKATEIFTSVKPLTDILKKKLLEGGYQQEFSEIYDWVRTETKFRGSKKELRKAWEELKRQHAADIEKLEEAKRLASLPELKSPKEIAERIARIDIAAGGLSVEKLFEAVKEQIHGEYKISNTFIGAFKAFVKGKGYKTLKSDIEKLDMMKMAVMPPSMAGKIPEGLAVDPETGELYDVKKGPTKPIPATNPPSPQILRFTLPRAHYKSDEERTRHLMELEKRISKDIFELHSFKPFPIFPDVPHGDFTAAIEVSVKSSLENREKIAKFLQQASDEAIKAAGIIPDITSRDEVLLADVNKYAKTPDPAKEIEKARAIELKSLNELRRVLYRRLVERKNIQNVPESSVIDANELVRRIGMRSMPITDEERAAIVSKDIETRGIQKLRDLLYKRFIARPEYTKTDAAVIDANELLRRISLTRMPPAEDEINLYKEYDMMKKRQMDDLVKHAKEVRRSRDTYLKKYFVVGEQDAIRRALQAEYAGRPGVTLEDTSKNIGTAIDQLTTRAGALGRVSWLFTSIAMGALGVYFSIMSISNAIMRGVQTVMGPLMNLDSIIQGYALNQAFLSGTALDLNDYMKKLGLGGMQDVINASLKLQALFGTLTAAFGMFAAKLVLDPEVFEALKKIVGDIMEFFTREDVYETFKGLIVELSKHMPEILNTFKWLADVVRTVLVPNIGIIVKLWTVSMLVMPAASLASALLNVGKVALSAGKMIQLAFSAKTFSEFTAGLMGMQGAMTGIGATLGTAFGIAFAAAAGAAIGLFVVNILDKFGILRELHKLGYSIGHGGSLEGYGWKKESMLEESGLGFLKFMAAGGTLKAGEPAVVGEQGPELIIPKGDVEVVPNKKLRFLAAGTSIGNAMGSAGIDDNTRALKDNTEALKKSAESKKDVTAYLDSLVMAGNPIYSDFTITSGGGPKSARDAERAGPWIFQQGNRIERVQGESVLRGQISKSYPEVEIPKVEDKEKKPTRTIFDDIGKVMSWLQPKLSIMGPATLMGQPGMGIATQLAMGAFGAKTLLGNNKIAHAPDVKAEASNKTAFDKLVEGNLVTNKVLNEMKSQQHEDVQDISKNVVGVKNIIQFKKFGSETVMNVTGNAGGTGIGTAGNIPARGGIGTGKTGTTGTEAKHLPWVEETKGGNAGWSEGLTGNPLVDFSKTGKGWSTKYTPGGMYGPGGSAGAPSVSYGGINPYTRPANDNGKAMQTDSGAWYYTDYTGRTFGPYNVDGEQEAISAAAKEGAQTTAPPAPSENAKPKNMYDQLSKLGITIEQSSDTDKQTNDVAVMKRYAAAGGPNVWGSIVEFAKAYGFEWYGTIPESDVYSYMISGNPKAKPGRPWKPVPSMAAGGIITGAGLINAHAGEVIGPLGQVAGLITQAVTNTNVTTNTSSPNVNITINISGNATKEVIDDMVRKLKRELFGRGVL